MATSKKSEANCTTLPKISEQLSAQEESILRLNKGLGANDDIPLKRKSSNREILARLEQLENEIIERAKAKGFIN